MEGWRADRNSLSGRDDQVPSDLSYKMVSLAHTTDVRWRRPAGGVPSRRAHSDALSVGGGSESTMRHE